MAFDLSMDVTGLFSSILVFLLVLYLTRLYLFNCKLPPGPWGLPYTGYAPFLDRQRFSGQITELCKKYHSDILCITSFNNARLVVLNSYELAKEVFQKRSDAADRPLKVLFSNLDKNHSGIITTSGDQWKEARRLSLSILRNFGMGRIGAEERIQKESEILAECFKEYQGEAFNPQKFINVAVSNIISGIVFGQRYDHTDEEFHAALQGMNDLMLKFSRPAISLVFRSEIAKKYLFKDLANGLITDFNRFAHFVDERIEEHKKTYDGEVSDMIYAYMKEMEEGNSKHLDEYMLRSLIIDFFFAGSETTYTTLRWAFLSMAAFPEIQKKVHAELDTVIDGENPSMSDKTMTPYTEAVLCEVQRHYTLVRFAIAHTNLDQDLEVRGHLVPKNSLILSNLDAIHHDKTWKNAHEFDPENFLEDGKVANTERLVPFGIGRRACAGEALARMELYIFFAKVLREFELKLENDTKADLEGITQGVYQPKPFKLRMIPRRS